MTFQVNTNTLNQSLGSVTMNGSYSGPRQGLLFPVVDLSFDWGYGGLGNSTPTEQRTVDSGSWNRTLTVLKDTPFSWRAVGYDEIANQLKQGGTDNTITRADNASIGTPSAGQPTQATCTVSVTGVNYNTVTSTGNTRCFFKKSTDANYSSTAVLHSGSGSGAQPTISTFLSGLSAGTIYNYYFEIQRTTINASTLDSSIQSFTTLPAQTLTTNPATRITAAGAQLNATVNPQAANNSVTYIFDYGKTTSYELGSTALQGPVSGTLNVLVYALIQGLTPNTVYHFRARAFTSEVTVYGLDQSLTTAPGDPALGVF